MISKKQRDTIAKMMDEEWKSLSLEKENFNCLYDAFGYTIIEVEGKWLYPADATFKNPNDEDKEWSRRRLVQYLYGYRVLKDMVRRLGLYWERNEKGRHYVGNN